MLSKISLAGIVIVIFNISLSTLQAETNSNDNQNIITKTNRLIKGSKITETIKTVDADGNPLPNANITVSVEDKNIVAINVKNISDEDKITDNTIVAKSDLNGQRLFNIKGLKAGSTIIHFEIIPEGGTENDKTIQALKINVKELKLNLGGDW